MRRGTHHTEETKQRIREGLLQAREAARLIRSLSPARLDVYRRERAAGSNRSDALRLATSTSIIGEP